MRGFHRALFAADLADWSRTAFDAACDLIRRSSGRLDVLNVIDPIQLPGPPEKLEFLSVLPGDTPEHRAQVEAQMRTVYRAEDPLHIHFHIWVGDPSEEVVRAADDLAADLVVLGTRGRTGVDRMIWGSVAESVLHHSRRPVVVVRDPQTYPGRRHFRQILHPTDFSTLSSPALRVALELARVHHATVRLLHVETPHETQNATSGDWPTQETLDRLRHDSEAAGLNVVVELRTTQHHPGDEILLAAHESHSDLIILGSHGRTGVRRLLMGSVSEFVLRSATCPTMIVRDAADPHEFATGGPA